MRIDPSRLSRILGALSQPPQAVSQQKTAATSNQKGTGTKKASRDIATLRSSLRTRLRKLSFDDSHYDDTAFTITIQEILAWEFGADIMNHPDFQRITKSIVETMIQDEKVAMSMKKIVGDMIS